MILLSYLQISYDKYNEIVSVDPVDGPVLMVDTKPDYIGRKIEKIVMDEGKAFIYFEKPNGNTVHKR